MKESTASALIVGGLIGGAILISGGPLPFGATQDHKEIHIMGSEGNVVGSWMPDAAGSARNIRVMKSQDGDTVEIDIMSDEARFEFDGTITELESMDLGGLEPEIQEMIEQLLSEDDRSGEREVEMRIMRKH